MPIDPSSGIEGLGRLVVAISADIKDLRKGFDQSRKDTDNFVKDVNNKLENFSNRTKNTFTNLGQTLATGFFVRQFAGLLRKNLIEPLIEFEDRLSIVATLVKTNVGPTMETFRGQLLDMGAEFGETTKVLSKGLFDVLSATIPVSDAMEVLRQGAIGAVAGATTTDVAIRALVRAMQSFEELGPAKIMDIFFRTQERALGTFQNIASTMPGVIAQARSFTLTLEELSATTAFLSQGFATFSQAGKGLEGILNDLRVGPELLRRGLQRMGTSLEEVRARLGKEGLFGAIQFIIEQDAGRGLVDSLFRRRQAAKAIALMTADMKGWEEEIGIVMDNAGASQEAFSKRVDTTSFRLSKLRGEWTALVDEAIAPSMPLFNTAIEGLTKFLQLFRSLPPHIKATIGEITLVGTAIASIAAIGFVLIRALGLIFGSGSVIFTGATAILRFLGPAGIIIAGFFAWRDVIKLVAKEFPELQMAADFALRVISDNIGFVFKEWNALRSSIKKEPLLDEKDLEAANAALEKFKGQIKDLLSATKDKELRGIIQDFAKETTKIGKDLIDAGFVKRATEFIGNAFDRLQERINKFTISENLRKVLEEELKREREFALEVARGNVSLDKRIEVQKKEVEELQKKFDIQTDLNVSSQDALDAFNSLKSATAELIALENQRSNEEERAANKRKKFAEELRDEVDKNEKRMEDFNKRMAELDAEEEERRKKFGASLQAEEDQLSDDILSFNEARLQEEIEAEKKTQEERKKLGRELQEESDNLANEILEFNEARLQEEVEAERKTQEERKKLRLELLEEAERIAEEIFNINKKFADLEREIEEAGIQFLREEGELSLEEEKQLIRNRIAEEKKLVDEGKKNQLVALRDIALLKLKERAIDRKIRERDKKESEDTEKEKIKQILERNRISEGITEDELKRREEIAEFNAKMSKREQDLERSAFELRKKLGQISLDDQVDFVNSRIDKNIELFEEGIIPELDFQKENIKLQDELADVLIKIQSIKEKGAKKGKEEAKDRLTELKEELRATQDLSEAIRISLQIAELEVKSFGEKVQEIFQRVTEVMEDSFSDLFFNIMTGEMKSFKDFFKDFTRSLIRIWSDMLAKMIADWIKNQIKTRIEARKTGGILTEGTKQTTAEMTSDFNKMGQSVLGMFSSLGNGIMNILGKVGSFFGIGGSKASAAKGVSITSPDFVGPRLPGPGQPGGPLGPPQPPGGLLQRAGGLSGILGAAGAGATAGGIIGQLTGKGGIGSTIGGAVGGLAGAGLALIPGVGPLLSAALPILGGAGGGFLGGLFGGGKEKDPVRAEIKKWVSGTLIPTLDKLTKLGFSQGVFGTGAGTNFFKQLGFEAGVPQAILERMVKLADKLQDILTNTISKAFEKSTKESAWRTFLRDVREGLSDFVTEGFVKAIVKSGLITKVLAPFFEETDKLLRRFKKGKISQGELETGVTTAFKRVEPNLLGLQNTIEGLFGTLQGINDVIEGTSRGNLFRILPTGFLAEVLGSGGGSVGLRGPLPDNLGKKEVTVNAPVTVNAEINNPMNAVRTGKGISWGIEKEIRRATFL